MPKNIPSTAMNPDLDWSQIRETVMMLNVALSQVERSMTEGDESINSLGKQVTSLMGKVKIISMASESLPESKEKETILKNGKTLNQMVNDIIETFQFYDRLTQRLSHVSFSLSSLAELINEPSRLYSPYEWKGLQEIIKSRYPIDADRKMFEAILNGSSVAEALRIGNDSHRTGSKKGEVELF